LFRFLFEIKIGDIVVYPSKQNRQVNIGRIEGDYQYAPDANASYPNMRAVQWVTSVPRTTFSQGALYEIGSAMSFFQVRNYADEYIAALEGKPIPIAKPGEDETVAYVVEDIEQTVRDFILKRLAQQLKGHPLAHFVAHLLQAMGYRTRVSPEGPDGGIDIIAHKDSVSSRPSSRSRSRVPMAPSANRSSPDCMAKLARANLACSSHSAHSPIRP
jgi:restriction system protein